jgi:meiotic recombination protein SPO11
LKKIFDHHGLPIYALTDADPHGLEIMFTYRFGSLVSEWNTINTWSSFNIFQAQSHNSEHLAIPSIRWIGVHSSDIQQFQLPTLQLTSEDESKLKDILKRPYMNEAFHHQIHLMLSMRLKAEIEGFSAIDMNYLIDEYIPMKIGDNIFL